MSYLFWYKILFITELLVAETINSSKLPKRNFYIIRLLLFYTICYLITIIYPLRQPYTWYYCSFMFFSIFLISSIGLIFVYKVKLINVVFYGVSSYTIQHLSYELFCLVNVSLLNSNAFITNAYNSDTFSLSSISGMMALSLIIYIFIYTIIYIAGYFFINQKLEKDLNLKFKNVTIIFFVIFALFLDIIFSSIYEYNGSHDSKINSVIIYSTNIVLCATILYIQSSMIAIKDAKNEISVISHLFKQYQDHYKIQKECIDLVNQKCHDLKHQIRSFAKIKSISSEASEELESTISIYDCNINTGNSALDIILSEKSLLCHDRGITLTCGVNGKCLSFMKETNLYALFGNILDNAIEAVSKVEDKTKRCINFHVESKGKIIRITCDNYFVDKLIIGEDGFPKTVRNDSKYHGFGIKSIKSIVEQYNGNFIINTQDDIFQLSIVLVSIPENNSI